MENQSITGLNQDRSLSWATGMILYPIYFIYIVIMGLILDEYHFVTIVGIIQMLVAYFIFSALIVLWVKRGYSWVDVKTKLILSIMLFGGVLIFTGLFWHEEDVDPSSYANLFQYLLVLLDLLLIPMFLGFVMFKYLLRSMDLLNNPLKEIYQQVNKKNYSAKIEDERVLNDSVFGEMAKFVNLTMEMTNNLIGEFNSVSDLALSISEELSSSSEEVNNSAAEVADTSQAMATGASQQAEMIALIDNDIKQVTATFAQISQEIETNAQAVSQIALQTNILALNAGIEASRAGDYGRGFAVVAENVRRLSDESKTAAEKIGSTASNIIGVLERLIDRVSSSVENISSVSEETSASSEEVAAAAEEVTASMREIGLLAIELTNQIQKSQSLLIETQFT